MLAQLSVVARRTPTAGAMAAVKMPRAGVEITREQLGA
jgi:hypothetical protein